MGSLVIPRLADIIGRKKPYCFGLLTFGVLVLIFPFCTNLKLLYVLTFIGGITEAGRYYVGFVYL